MNRLSPALLRSTVRELPALSALVMELIEMMGRDDVAAEQLVGKISLDQALTAKTLRLANSSFYGVPRQVNLVREAISVLGLRTVRSVVTAAAVTDSFKPPVCDGFDFVDFWRHSIGTAVCARLLADELKFDPEVAFTAGLLHDLGKLVLASCFPSDYGAVLQQMQASDAFGIELEQSLLGLDHAAAGGLMAEHWRFTSQVVEVIRLHHAPPGDGSGSLLCNLVHVADNIVHALDLVHVEADAVPQLSSAAWARLGLSAPRLGQIFEQTETQTRSVCAVLL